MEMQRRSGPYAPETQALGQTPEIIPDIPVSSVFLALFLGAGVLSFITLLRNKKRGHKFIINGALFGFAKLRIATFALRMVWACYPTSVKLGLASTIFVYAGIIILFDVNLIFAQRIVRAQHPGFGWRKPTNIAFNILFISSIVSVLLVIVAVLQSFMTLDTTIRHIDRIIQLCALFLFATLAILPALIVSTSTAIALFPRNQIARLSVPVDKFGTGHMQTKVWICASSAVWLSLGAGFRAGVSLLPPTPIMSTEPAGPDGPIPNPTPWYLSKVSFYSFNFVVELIVLGIWLILRVDRRFYVPDKANGAYFPRPRPRHDGSKTATSSIYTLSAFNHSRSYLDYKEPDAIDFDFHHPNLGSQVKLRSSAASIASTAFDDEQAQEPLDWPITMVTADILEQLAASHQRPAAAEISKE